MHGGPPPARYLDGDTPTYERIGRYEARYNRLLIYRGNTLHGAEVPEGLALTDDPRTGRFSVNTFVWLDANSASSPDVALADREDPDLAAAPER